MENVNRRLACLVESHKKGFTLVLDPNGSFNRCFYQCIGKHFNMNVKHVVTMVQEFMMSNQVVDIIKEVTISTINCCSIECLAS